MFYTPINPEWCLNNVVIYFPLSSKNQHFAKHWASETVVTFGETRYNEGIILDTGASVVALPSGAFYDFVEELRARGIKFKYYPDKLSGVISCSMISSMPSWYIGDKSSRHHFRVTPAAYVFERAGSDLCVVDVAKVSSGHPIIFGLPVLRTSISEFNQYNNSIGLCTPNSIDPKYADKPLTSPRGPWPNNAPRNPGWDDFSSEKSFKPLLDRSQWLMIFSFLGFSFIAV